MGVLGPSFGKNNFEHSLMSLMMNEFLATFIGTDNKNIGTTFMFNIIVLYKIVELRKCCPTQIESLHPLQMHSTECCTCNVGPNLSYACPTLATEFGLHKKLLRFSLCLLLGMSCCSSFMNVLYLSYHRV